MKRILPGVLSALLLSIISVPLFGQGLCNVGGGGFQLLPKSQGCAPLVIDIKSTINGTSIAYAQYYDGKTESPTLIRNAKQFIYSIAGDFTMLQSATVNGQEVYHCEKVKIYENKAPTTTYSSCGGGKIK